MLSEAATWKALNGRRRLTLILVLAAAAAHLARTICRRAERSLVQLKAKEKVSDAALRYLNRLSDLLFTLARLANHIANAGEVTW